MEEIIENILAFRPLDDCNVGVVVYSSSFDYEPIIQIKRDIFAKQILMRNHGNWMIINNTTQIEFMLDDLDHGYVLVVWWQSSTEPPLSTSESRDGVFSHYEEQENLNYNIKEIDLSEYTVNQFAVFLKEMVAVP